MNLDIVCWGLIEKALKSTATLFGVSVGWVLFFYAGFTVLTYLRLKEGKK